jgi:hypothetical protein
LSIIWYFSFFDIFHSNLVLQQIGRVFISAETSRWDRN